MSGADFDRSEDVFMALPHELIIFSGVATLTGAHIIWEFANAIKRGVLARQTNIMLKPPDDRELSRISVLIPAWCEATTIEGCLANLREVDYPNWEIIVISGGSDGTFERTQELSAGWARVRVLQQQPGGKNAALQQGLKYASGEVIVILDADSLVESSWLWALVQALDSGYDAVCGNYAPLRDTWITRTEEMERIECHQINQTCILQGSGSIAIRRDILEAIGGFPTHVTVGVDWDMDTRLTAKGFKKKFVDQAKLYTQRPATLREYWRNEVRWRRAHLRSLWQHGYSNFGSITAVVRNTRYYIMNGLAFMSLILLGTAFAHRLSAHWAWIAAYQGLFLTWIVARRATIAVMVAAYSGDRRWLKLAWAPPTLLLLSFAATGSAVMTIGRRIVHFRGPRPIST